MNVATLTGRRLDWRGILALILVPLLVAGTFLGATWHFGANLRKVQAAVVNHDKMVEINGQKVPLGRQLSAALVDSEREQNFTWVLADDANATAGLASGAYAAVVTIPENFSAAATSHAGAADEAHQATITITTSPVAGIAETALGQSVADAAAQSINDMLSRLYLDNIYVGFNTMGAQFVTVAEGARQLADGSAKLTDGLGQATAGADQLASGLGTAVDGGQQLKTGGAKLASGASQLSNGLGQMASQTKDMPAQIQQLSTGADQVASGTAAYSAGVDQYVDGINSIVDPVLKVVQQLPDLTALFAQLDAVMADLPAQAATLDSQVQAAVTLIKANLADAAKLQAALTTLAGQLGLAQQQVDAVASGATTVPCPANLQAVQGGCAAFAQGVQAGGAAASQSLAGIDASKVSQLASTLAANSAQINDALDKIAAASAWLNKNAGPLQSQWNAIKAQIPAGTTPNEYLTSQLTRLRDGGQQLKDGGHQLSSGTSQLAGGIRQLNAGVPALVDGIAQASSGASQLSSGTAAYVDGVGQFVDGVGQARDGAAKLASGLHDATSGSQKLTDGLDQLASGLEKGQKDIPSYSASQRENLAKVVSSPVDTGGLTGLVTPAVAAVSLLLVLALWLGALATYALVKPVDPRNAASSSTTPHLVRRTLLPGVGVAGVQAVVLAGLGSTFLGLGWPAGLGLAGVLLVAGLAFTTVNHALAAWGGVWGRLASGAMLLITAVTALTYATPSVFGTLRPLSPLSPALDASRQVITWHSAALAIVTLVGWCAIGLIAGAWRIARSRTVSVKALALAS